MGQIFYASVYDTENKRCFTMEVDKFHAKRIGGNTYTPIPILPLAPLYFDEG